jgi:methyl-accepting chemotaxis protein
MLQNELADMTSHAEDSETVSRQRMELVQSTREKLKNSRAKVEELTTTKKALVANIKEWTKKTAAAEKLVEDLQIEVTDSNGSCHQLDEQYQPAEFRRQRLEGKGTLCGEPLFVYKWSL